MRLCFTLMASGWLLVGCATSTEVGPQQQATLYPPRPEHVPGPPLADPPLQRPTMHLAISAAGLSAMLDAMVPKSDVGSYALLGARQYGWERGPFSLAFDDARKAMLAVTEVVAKVEIPGTTMELTLRVTADVQPVITSTHRLALQAVKVTVDSDDRRVRMAEWGAGLVQHIQKSLTQKLSGLSVDLSPTFLALHEKLNAPLFLPLGDANACFSLDVRGIEAGPTVLADGLEKQLALVVAPSITMPCTLAKDGKGPVVVDASTPQPKVVKLPPLHHAAGVEGGPFTLVVPIAASYSELQKAARLAFAGGKLFFSDDNPHLYISDPDIYSSGGDVVVKVRLGGFVDKGGVQLDIAGDIYLSGRPQVRDNFLEFPDLRPTVETRQALLSLAAAVHEEKLTAAVRKALRLDLSDRMSSLKQKLTDALSVRTSVAEGVPELCTRADVGRIEISDIQAHDAYMRVYVKTTALASAYLPCPS